jgi:histone H3/H4
MECEYGVAAGTIRRICKPIAKAKECRVSKEFSIALSAYVTKCIKNIVDESADVTLAKNRKVIDLDSLKVVAEKRGFEV